MSTVLAIETLADELEDPGVVTSIQQHVASGCPLAPLVEAVTPNFDPRDRPRLIAAMVERAKRVIADRAERADHDETISRHDNEFPRQRKAGRPKSSEREAVKAAAHVAGVSESTARRDLVKAEVIVPKPPKPVPVETLVVEFAAKVEALLPESRRVLEYALADKDDRVGTWRAALRLSVGALEGAPAQLRDIANDIKLSRAKLARTDWEAGKAAKKVKDDAEKQAAREARWAKKQEERRARAEMVAEHGPAAYMSPLPPPTTGLGGKSLQGQLVDEEGNEMPYQEALEQADAAGVGGGPPETHGWGDE